MKQLSSYQYSKVQEFAKQIKIETAYPSSLIAKNQTGWIYVDSASNPSYAIFFHYCGFTYLTGTLDTQALSDFKRLFLHKCKTENRCYVILLEENDKLLQPLYEVFSDVPEMTLLRRDLFDFDPNKGRAFASQLPQGFELCKLNETNIPLLEGHIIPSYSFQSTKDFMERGFGVGIIDTSTKDMAGCAFSSGVGAESIDIGIEVAPTYRNRGFATILANTMVNQTLEQNKLPDWGCNSSNLGSRNTALKAGFVFRRNCLMYQYCI